MLMLAWDPELTNVKSAAILDTDADTSGDVSVGDTLSYTVTVTNTGNVTLNNVVVSDAQLTPSSFSCPTLAPDATCVLTGTHVVTQAEEDAGQVVNTASVSSDELADIPSNTVTTPVEMFADLVTIKSLASGDSTPEEGDTVTFEIEVVNNGTAQATA